MFIIRLIVPSRERQSIAANWSRFRSRTRAIPHCEFSKDVIDVPFDGLG
jgi:hypothetical protein